MAHRIRSAIPYLVIFILALLIYSNTFNASFHFDDHDSIVKNLHIRHIFPLRDLWNYAHTRFLTYLTIAFNYKIGRLNVTGYHAVNILFHIAAGIFTYALALLTFKTPRIKGLPIANHGASIAFFTSLVFIAHPLQTQAVTYIIQRASSLATLFYIASIALYVRSRLLKSALSYILFLGAALCALLCKEMTVTLPFVILLYEFTFFTAEGRRRSLLPMIFAFSAAFIFIPFHIFFSYVIDFIILRRITDSPADLSGYHFLLTQFPAILTYIRLLFVPLNQTVDHDFRVARSIFEFSTFLSVVALLIIIIRAFRRYRQERLISFSILWFFITLTPSLRLLPDMHNFIVEHRLYLPMFGFSLFLVTTIHSLAGKKKAIALLAAIVTILSGLTYMRNFTWKDELTLWNDTVHKSPKRAGPYNNRGLAYCAEGNLPQALSDYNKAIEIDPNYADAYNNRGIAYRTQGNLPRAISDYNKAIELNPRLVEAYNNRGSAYRAQGDLPRAISDFSKAIEMNPILAEAYNNRGNAYCAQGDLTHAIPDFNKAIEINPRLAEAYNNRGSAYFAQGDLPRAISDFSKAIAIDPILAEGYNNRGNAYCAQGDLPHAISDFNKAVAIDSNYAVPYNNRGLAYRAQGNLTHAISDFSKAIEINPILAEAYYNRSVTYYTAREYGNAWADVHRAEELGFAINSKFLDDLKKASGS